MAGRAGGCCLQLNSGQAKETTRTGVAGSCVDNGCFNQQSGVCQLALGLAKNLGVVEDVVLHRKAWEKVGWGRLEPSSVTCNELGTYKS